MRNLATIRKIVDIQPIEGKDRIALATVDGWHVIIQKNDFKVGDLCVYCEIDSVLPEKPEFEFLRKRDFRIRTMKMAGVISQGICFPLSILPPKKVGYFVGDDVTDVIGVTQYVPTMDVEPEPVKKSWLMRFKWYRKIMKHKHPKKASFPRFVKKTDETRIQDMPYILDVPAKWTATEKIDGQSGTFALEKKRTLFGPKYKYYVCSRNLCIPKPDNSSYWKVSEKYDIENVLKKLIGDNDWIAIQGECIGPGIQKNKYKLTEYDMYVFNLITSSENRLTSIRATKIIEDAGLKFVPILGTNINLNGKTVDEVVESADGDSLIGDTLREGFVFRSEDGRQSFKAVSNKFLLHYYE